MKYWLLSKNALQYVT